MFGIHWTFLAIPENWEAQIRPRSGLAIKQGITCLNTPGTIDADYRGEIKVILINLSKESQIINDGDRIAQMVFQSVEKVDWELVVALDETQRGAGGFGHTGKNNYIYGATKIFIGVFIATSIFLRHI